MTKDEIINCTDGQALADAVAVECMGWELAVDESVQVADWIDTKDGYMMRKSMWQPHQPTEKGKAQCWDLIVKRNLDVFEDCESKMCARFSNEYGIGSTIYEENLQIAVLKAALLSQLGEGNE